MIDYYKAIDTETGQEVPYLREVSNRISPEMSAQDCFVSLSFLREELEELWTMVPWIKKVSVYAVNSTRFAQSFSQTMRSYNMTENSDRLRERPWKLRRGRPLILAMYQVKRKSLLNLLR